MTSFNSNMVSTPTPFSTRLATQNDVQTLREIGIKTFRDTFSEYNTEDNMRLYLTKTFTLDQVKSEINDPSVTFILAELGNQIVGYAKLREGNNPKELGDESGIEIERIYSIKEYIGKNVGKTLINVCLDIARQRGYMIIWLGVWEHNPRAIAFYEKWGFEKFGSHPFLLGNDLQTDLLMKLKL